MHRSVSFRNKRNSRQTSAVARSAAAACEPLETRRLLSTINWSNKGTGAGAGDTDDFNLYYGANAALARNIVQRAIDDWERVIVDFNYSNGGNTYTVDITAAPISGRGAAGINSQLGGKPTNGSIQMDDNGGGEGWYFDPNIGSSTLPDDSEFTNLITPFNASFTGVGGANDDDDLYRTIAHELGHCMGISGGDSLLLDDNFTDIGADPNDAGSRLLAWNINGGAVEATFTTNTGTHLYEGPTILAGGTAHPNELMNPGRTVGAPPTERQLISNLTATILRDAYDYTVTLPSTINTFQANLNTSTNRLTINGLAGTTNETITLNTSGANQVIAVTGTSETIATAQIDTIVVEASGGNDSIFINDLPALTARATINGGAGNDTFHIGGGDYDTNIQDLVEVNGDAGTDRVEFEDTSDTLDDSYLLGSLFFSKDSSSFNTILNTVEGVQIEASDTGNNTLAVTGVAVNRPVTLLGQGGNDTFNLGSGSNLDATLTDDVIVNGGAGDDSLVADDSAETDSHNYSGSTSSIGRSGSTGGITYTATEDVTLNAGTNDDTAQFGGTLAGVTLRVNLGTGADLIEIGQDLDSNFNGVFVGNGGGGTDTIVLDDTADPLDDDYTITGTSLNKSPLPVSISYGLFENIALEANEGINQINFSGVGSAQTLRLFGFGGDDTFVNTVQDINTQIGGTVSIVGGAGADAITLNDSGDATADGYTLTNNSFQVTAGSLSGPILYNTIETFAATTNNQPTPINVTSALASVSYSLNGGDGNDTFNIGGGDFDNIDSNIGVNGGAGTDRVLIDDTADTLDDTYELNGSGFSKNTGTGAVSWGGLLLGTVTIEQFVLDASEANNTINVNSLGGFILQPFPDPAIPIPIDATLNGNGGNDNIIVATGGSLASVRGDVSVVGGAGTDSLTANDASDSAADSFALSNTSLTNSNWNFQLNYANTLENFTLEGGTGANSMTVNSTFGGTNYRLNGNASTDTLSVLGSNVAVALDGGAGLDTINVNTDGVGTAQARTVNNQDLQLINIAAGGILTQGTGKLLIDTVGAVIGGRLNLTDGGYIDRAATIEATYRTLLTSGYAGGTWNGPEASIISSAAAGGASNDGLGYGTAAQTGLASFFGSAVAGGDLLIRYTFNGDNNLDGTVNISDFANLASNFNVPNTNWVRGNYNYDLITDISDFAQLASNFNQSVPADLPRAAASSGASVFNDSPIEEQEDLAEDILV